MQPTDTISVLLCVHSQTADNDRMLQRALESLVSQSYGDFEVVVILDQCHEDTRGVVDPYDQVLNLKVLERPCKQGLAAAKNYGITKCSGTWIAYLDADDTWLSCKLEVQRAYMLKHPEIDFCGTESWDRDEADIWTPNCFGVGQYQTHVEITRRLPEENVMCHGSMMIRASALAALNNYDASTRCLGWEDWDLWLRAARGEYIFGKVPERLYVWSAGTSVAR